MDDVQERLERCFMAVFPDLGSAEVRDASPDSLETWDSLANATLVTVVEEEFDLEIPPDELGGLQSFEEIAAYLRRARDGS